MNRFVSLGFITLLAITGFAMPVIAARQGVTIIGVDISGSAPLVLNQAIADNAASYLKSAVIAMQPGERLRVLSIGRAGIAERAIDLKATIGNRSQDRPEVIASQLERFFRSLPGKVEAGSMATQNATSLIDFLEGFEAHDCTAIATRIILFTDGLEASHRVSQADLVSGKAVLPMPKTSYLKGCDIEIRGVGQLNSGEFSDGLFARLKPQWAAFFETAGAGKVIISREVGGF